jgi:hypothetical protein
MTPASRDELISAALDGEAVDVTALRDALSAAEGREALAAFLLLKATVVADPAGVRPGLDALAPPARPAPRLWLVAGRRRVPIGVAASIAAALVIGAFWVGTAWRANVSDRIQQAPQATGAAHPVPSRVVRFTPGVDWHQGS